jgi:transposase
MDIIFPCCAGLDVHKKTVVACIRRLGPEGQPEEQVRTFGTMTGDLLELADWLATHGVTTVAIESTGVYWKPVYYILEDLFPVMLVNAQHIKQVPGRKTDVKDCQWIAELLQYGLLHPSFVPPTEIRELRDLTRQRAQLVSERTAVSNRIQKVLEDANIKLSSVASDVLGVSGRAMIAALIGGESDPEQLAELARRRLRGKIPQLQRALQGRVSDHHRFLLRMLMDDVRHLDQQIEQFNDRMDAVMTPFSQAVDRLMTIPGVNRRAAEVIVAEIGTDMSRFPTAGHLSSWAGMCSGNHESAGKRRSGRTTKGDRWLRQTLVQVAWAASHTKQTFLAATYHRWVKRMGKKRALVALGHKILVLIYELLKDRTTYQEQLVPGQAA